jgi:carbonic anhydrase/acetyltransferase-like protein (isoleucine patch superfamily)
LQLVFHNSVHHLHLLVDDDDNHECPASSLKVFGQSLIIRNIQTLSTIFHIDKVIIPEGLSNAAKLVQDNFPFITTEGFSDDDCHHDDNNKLYEIKIGGAEEGRLKLPINAFIHCTASRQQMGEEQPCLIIDTIIYPWDFLKLIQQLLYDNIKDTIISPDASIAKSSIIEGPCIIEDGVTIDDFCKIKGPTYIGKGSFIGMSSLIRNCMIGEKTRIGFNCEIARSYFAGHDKMSHQNVILDSVIGKGVWFGGYSGTANVLLNRQNIRYELNGQLVDTGTNHFGAVVGNNCSVGASVITLPGRQVTSNSIIQAGTIFGKKKC